MMVTGPGSIYLVHSIYVKQLSQTENLDKQKPDPTPKTLVLRTLVLFIGISFIAALPHIPLRLPTTASVQETAERTREASRPSQRARGAWRGLPNLPRGAGDQLLLQSRAGATWHVR